MNNGQKQSQSIPDVTIANLIDAATFAELNDMSLTRFISINLEAFRQRPQHFISIFLKRVSDWLRIRRMPCAYIWVLEWPANGPLNCHILLHVPDNILKAFAKNERRWIRQAGLVWKKNVLVSTKVGIPRGAHNRKLSDGEHLVNLEYAMSYMFKGADRDVCDLLGIEWRPQGTITGKRVGVSENISVKARASAGYAPRSSERGSILFNKRYRLMPELLAPGSRSSRQEVAAGPGGRLGKRARFETVPLLR